MECIFALGTLMLKKNNRDLTFGIMPRARSITRNIIGCVILRNKIIKERCFNVSMLTNQHANIVFNFDFELFS